MSRRPLLLSFPLLRLVDGWGGVQQVHRIVFLDRIQHVDFEPTRMRLKYAGDVQSESYDLTAAEVAEVRRRLGLHESDVVTLVGPRNTPRNTPCR